MIVALVAALAWLGLEPSAVPRDTPAAVDLATVLRLADASPVSAAMAAEVDVARADEGHARLRPNPQVEYQGYGRLFGTAEAINGQQHQIDLGVPLLLAGQRRARMRSASARTEVVRAGTCMGRRDLKREAAAQWVELLAAQDRVDRLSEGRVALESAATLTRERAERGGQTRYDAERVEHELHLLDSDIEVADADLHDASRRLATVLGRPDWSPRARGTVANTRVDLGAARDDLDALPEVAVARRIDRLAETDVALARKERWPVPVLSVGTYVTTDGDSASLTFGVALPIPVFDRGQARLSTARAEVRRARAHTHAVRHLAAGELTRATDVLQRRRAALEAFGPEARDVAPRLRTMAQRAYEGGASSVLELIDAERTHLEAQLRELDLARAVLDAELDLAAARGRLGGGCEPSSGQ